MKHYSFSEELPSDKGELHVLVEVGEATILPHDDPHGRSITIEADLRHMTIDVTRQDNVVSVRVEQEDKDWLQKLGRLFSSEGHPKATVVIHVPRTCTVYAKTITGQMRISDIDAPVTATVVTGRNELANIGARIDARTTTGDVRYDGLLVNDHHRFEATTGSVRLNLPKEPNAQFDGRVITGNVHCDFPLAQSQINKALTGNHVKGILGSGEGMIKAQIITGSLRVQKTKSKEAVSA
ncbi:MAG: DUF4097 family beta strand repeat protein [Ardenticatenaceae bacterium]|nr:DUF4097 family beta strand repeat protein [Ardenticatenaceae bacterium]